MFQLPSAEAPIKLLTNAMLAHLRTVAHASPRLRTNYNFHPTLDENPHRFLNVMCRGTYITPHRHSDPPKAESFLVLSGLIAFLVFDSKGGLERITLLGPDGDALGIDIAPGIYHSLFVLSDDAVCYEVKPGPYAPASDKEFAPWAPKEGSPNCGAYLARLEEQIADYRADAALNPPRGKAT